MKPETVKYELPKLMKKYNVRPEYLALKLDYSFSAVLRWVKGERKPRQIAVDKLNQIFNGFKTKQKREG